MVEVVHVSVVVPASSLKSSEVPGLRLALMEIEPFFAMPPIASVVADELPVPTTVVGAMARAAARLSFLRYFMFRSFELRRARR